MRKKLSTSGLTTWPTRMCEKNCNPGEKVVSFTNPKALPREESKESSRGKRAMVVRNLLEMAQGLLRNCWLARDVSNAKSLVISVETVLNGILTEMVVQLSFSFIRDLLERPTLSTWRWKTTTNRQFQCLPVSGPIPMKQL